MVTGDTTANKNVTRNNSLKTSLSPSEDITGMEFDAENKQKNQNIKSSAQRT